MKITVTLSSYEVSEILDSMDTKIKALNHVLESNNLESDLLYSCKLEILQYKKLIKKLNVSFIP